MSEEDIPKDSDDRRGYEHNEAIQKTMDKAKGMKDLQRKGYDIRRIDDEAGYTRCKIKNYLSPHFKPVYGQYDVQHPGKSSPFRNEVIALRSKGTTYKEIHASICNKGYTGSVAAIGQFIAKQKGL